MTDPKLPVLPDGLPPLPDPPAGHRWVYRGKAWKSCRACLYAVTIGDVPRWITGCDPDTPTSMEGAHYAEAVPLDGAPLAAGVAWRQQMADDIGKKVGELKEVATFLGMPSATPQPAPREWDEMKRVLKRIEGTVTIFGLDVQQTDQWWTGYHECLKDVRRMIEDVAREVPAQGAGGDAPLTFREAAWALTNMECRLSMIQKAADKARRKKSSDGHHCDFRAALDSIADTAKFDLEASRPVSQFYSNFAVAAVARAEKAEAELTAARAEAAGLRSSFTRLASFVALHGDECASRYKDQPCDCGLDALTDKAAALKAGEGAKGMSDDPVKWEDRCWHGSGRDSCRKRQAFRMIDVPHGVAFCEEHAASVKPEMLERIEEQPEPK